MHILIFLYQRVKYNMIEKKISRSKAPLCVALISSTRHKNGKIKLKKLLNYRRGLKEQTYEPRLITHR